MSTRARKFIGRYAFHLMAAALLTGATWMILGAAFEFYLTEDRLLTGSG